LESKRLEWGTKLHDDNNEITVNYTARVLGRSGVIEALLVSNPGTMQQDVQSFHKLLKNVKFVEGQTYAEFRPGDKVAEYGLAARPRHLHGDERRPDILGRGRAHSRRPAQGRRAGVVARTRPSKANNQRARQSGDRSAAGCDLHHSAIRRNVPIA
jgi:hypothetical protein